MRRAILATVGILVTLILAASATAADAAMRLSPAAGVRFPDRAFVLTLAKDARLDAGDVQVRENGIVLNDVELVPANEAARGQIGIVLAIDASKSMAGKPIAGAIAAARNFVFKRNANAQVAIVTFNRTSQIVQPFTTDDRQLGGALAAQPPLQAGTHIFDAIQTGLEALRQAHVAAGSIVVLSDGRDTGSAVSEEKVTRAAANAHVRIFTVGLQSRQFNPQSLRQIAGATNGAYVEASSGGDLEQIYSRLASRLSGEYLLRYHSPAAPGQTVHVAVSIKGVDGIAQDSYNTPKVPAKGASPFFHSFREKFWKSGIAVLLTALGSALLLSFGMMAILRPRSGDLRRRMGDFVSLAAVEKSGEETARPTMFTDRFLSGAENALEKKKWWEGFREDIQLAEIKMPPMQILLWSLIGTIMFAWFATTIVGSPVAALSGIAVPITVRWLIQSKVGRKRSAFAEQLPDNLQVLASALRAGHSLVGALSVVVDDAAEPTRSEFRRVIADEQLGVPLEDALEVVVRRMHSPELGQVSLVAALQRRTGGNSAEVLDRVVDTIRERAELRRLVRTLTAQGRMSRWVVTALPLVVMGAIMMLNRNYLNPLFHTSGGRMMLFGAAAMVTVGSYAIQKIVDIKV
jgi:tight adherence protein B